MWTSIDSISILRRERGGTGNDGRRTALAPGDRGASFAGGLLNPLCEVSER